MMNVFKYELKSLIKSILIWIVSIGGLLLMFLSIYPTFGEDAELMEKIMANYPPEMLKAFGMSSGLALSSVLGYLVFVFAFAQLLYAIQAANYGFAVLSVEEREFTADYLMSKPVSRGEILIAKFSASCFALIVTGLITNIILFVSVEAFRSGNTYEMKPLLLLMGSIFIFQLIFLSIGMMLSVAMRRIRNVLTYSLGLAFGTYILNAVRAIIGGKLMGVLSPFYYFDPGYILEHGKYNVGLLVLSITVVIVSLVMTNILYLRRDIYSL
jgi:ABC-2 type transport system permease protein